MAESSFKLSRPLEERIRVCAGLRKKHNGKIPLLLDKAEHSDLPAIDKNQKLASEDFIIGQVEQMLSKVTNLAAEKSIFVFVKNTLCLSDASISAIYEEHKDEDGFLYLIYSGEDLLFTIKTALGIADSMLREQGAEYIGYLSETWLSFLSTLEKLVSVSESHISLKESFEGLLKDMMDALCSLVSCFAKEGDRVWVMKLRDFTNFEVRSHFTKLLFPSGLEEFEKLQIVVDRLSLFEESVKQISEATPLLFQCGISVSKGVASLICFTDSSNNLKRSTTIWSFSNSSKPLGNNSLVKWLRTSKFVKSLNFMTQTRSPSFAKQETRLQNASIHL